MAPSAGSTGWGGSGSGARSVISPIVDLRTRLVPERTQQVMTVDSPVASYWRLTSPRHVHRRASGSPPTPTTLPVTACPGSAPPRPKPARSWSTSTLLGLSSIWLPAAFNPESVSGGGKVTWDPVSGSLLTAKNTADGLDYQVTSLQYLGTLNPRTLEAAPPPSITGPLTQDVQLPQIDPDVRILAEQITAGQRTEYDKALALQNYFYGPSFHYSLDPPFDGYGTDALTAFLFDTRTGYCQQFAGAYAVLARAIGLPTRLAVGFTTGLTDRPPVTTG